MPKVIELGNDRNKRPVTRAGEDTGPVGDTDQVIPRPTYKQTVTWYDSIGQGAEAPYPRPAFVGRFDQAMVCL